LIECFEAFVGPSGLEPYMAGSEALAKTGPIKEKKLWGSWATTNKKKINYIVGNYRKFGVGDSSVNKEKRKI